VTSGRRRLNMRNTSEALTLTGTIPDDRERSRALAELAVQLAAAAEPGDPALFERAVAVARTIPSDQERSETLVRIHAMTRIGMLDELSRWRLRSLGASIDLLSLFLSHSHDELIVESISHAVPGRSSRVFRRSVIHHLTCRLRPTGRQLWS